MSKIDPFVTQINILEAIDQMSGSRNTVES